MFDLKGHVAVVTGGNSGIGLGFARGLAKAGASLALWARDSEKSAKAVAELRDAGADVESFACDVTDPVQIHSQLAATLERFGRVDSCFANAGYGKAGSFLDITLDDWNEVVGVNLTATFLTFQAAARHMVERGGGGRLIATSSIGSVHGMPQQPHYSAAKAGICALVRSCAVALARYDIQANAILPGWIATPATEPAMGFQKLSDTIQRRTPARRWGTPEDLEGVAVYLASPESRFHTGDVLTLDGGYIRF